MKKRSSRGLGVLIALMLLLLPGCASQEPLSRGGINESNYQEIAAFTLAIMRLPEEAALAGYFTAHEDPAVDCISGKKKVDAAGPERVRISYESCGFENISWNGSIEQPVDGGRIPYAIIFGGQGGDFCFFQTDSTFFAPFFEQVGFSFKGDFSVDHLDGAELFSVSALDIHLYDDTFDDLHTFRNMSVNRSYDSGLGHHGFEMMAEISSDLIPIIDCEVTKGFQRHEDRYPYQGRMSIIAINDNSQVDLEVVSNGNQVMLRLDSDNDAVFERERSVSWEDLKGLLPAIYQALFSYYWHS